MQETTNNDNYEFHIDSLGQAPGLWNLYTQLTFCYEVPYHLSKQSIIETLTHGLERLTASFPWIAGQVVKQKNDSNSAEHDYYLVKPLAKIPELVIKDLSGELPAWNEFKQSQFPIRWLDEKVIAPRNTKSFVGESDPKPVLLIQATFVTGGLLLTFAAQHGTLDIVGQGQMIRLLSKACYGLPFTDDEIELGNRDRRATIPLLEANQEDSHGKVQSRTTKSSTSTPSTTNENMEDVNTDNNNNKQRPLFPSLKSSPSHHHPKTWANFVFSSSSLIALKSLATQSLPKSTAYISTDDALSAFIWQRITHARLATHSQDTNTTSTFARTVDIRQHLSIPPSYPGNLATKTYTTFTFAQLTADGSLGTISAALRRSIDPNVVDLGYQVRAQATKLVRPSYTLTSEGEGEAEGGSKGGEDKQRQKRDLARDIAFSSWAKLSYCHELDFNLGLGRPVAVRRPSFAPPGEEEGGGMEGVVYLLPKGLKGEIVATICLESEEMSRLRADTVWNRFVIDIG